MLIGVLSDAHLFHRNSQYLLYKKVIMDLQDTYNVDLIVDCGDLTDYNVMDASQAEKLRYIFSEVKVPFHIVMGNHDSLEGVSLASLLNMNKNINVHNEVACVNNVLFIPYINSAKQLYEKLKNLNLDKSVKYAFSHLNLTSNFYAMIPFERSRNLHMYADTIFNGHIHTPEENDTLYGKIINIGSCSSLTFSDEHTPSFIILDTDNDNFTTYPIKDSIIHRTKCFNDEQPIDCIIKEIEASVKSLFDYKINWRIKLSRNFPIEKKKKIKEYLTSLINTNVIQFDYYNDNKNNESQNSTKEHSNKQSKVPLIEQLFTQYEKDTGILLSEDIKKEIIASMINN